MKEEHSSTHILPLIPVCYAAVSASFAAAGDGAFGVLDAGGLAVVDGRLPCAA